MPVMMPPFRERRGLGLLAPYLLDSATVTLYIPTAVLLHAADTDAGLLPELAGPLLRWETNRRLVRTTGCGMTVCSLWIISQLLNPT